MTSEKEFEQYLANYENIDIEFRLDLNEHDPKQRIGKTVTALYNTRGGKIIFGISPDKKPVGLKDVGTFEVNLTSKITAQCIDLDSFPEIEIMRYKRKDFLILHCQKGMNAPYYVKGLNKPLVRFGSSNVEANREQIAQIIRDSSHRSFDRNPAPHAMLSHIDLKKSGDYIRGVTKKDIKTDAQLKQLLFGEGLLTKDKHKRYIPTIAGVLLFGVNPQGNLPQSMIKADASSQFSKSEWDDIEDINGTLFEQIEKFEAFIKRNLRASAVITGMKREENIPYPLEALREAFVNAIVHRDYGANDKVCVKIRDDSITIENPGEIIRPLMLEEVLKGNAHPRSRNDIIAKVLCKEDIMEQRGTGILRILRLCKEYKLKDVNLKEENGYFIAKFVSKNPREIMDIDERKILLIRYLKEHEKITTKEYQELVQKSEITAKRDLSKFKREKLIEFKGAAKTGYYILKNK